MIIKAHAHGCGPFSRGEKPIRVLDQIGVDRVILVPGQNDLEKEYSLPNLAGLFPNRDVVPITNSLTRVVTTLTGTLQQFPKGNKYVSQLTQCYPDPSLQFCWATLNVPGRPDTYPEYKSNDPDGVGAAAKLLAYGLTYVDNLSEPALPFAGE